MEMGNKNPCLTCYSDRRYCSKRCLRKRKILLMNDEDAWTLSLLMRAFGNSKTNKGETWTVQ